MVEVLLFYLIFSPFLVGILIPFFYRNSPGLISAAFAFIQFIIVLFLTRFLLDVDTYYVSIPWVPLAQVNLSFLIDGLALFFALLVTGMGALVFFYAHSYMNRDDCYLGRFYCYLNLFVGAMLGAIFANNLILLFLFWELTGVMSFLLISYNFEKTEARQAARMALLVTAGTGLCFLLGIVLIGVIDQTLDISAIAVQGVASNEHPFWMYGIMILLLIGAYGKSAQFPFHFWLPEAMAAPTPVSAYLHSATMVKLGIYLTARLYPLFIGTAIWFPFVTTFSLITILLGGFLALLAYPLKRILAYATICQLGFFMSFYGMGDLQGLEYDYVHIFNHALYKGSLFMLVGIIGHAAGITDIRNIGGLAKKLPLCAAIFMISIAAMAGVPGTTGFLSKELLLRDIVLLQEKEPTGALIFGALFLGLLFKVAFSFRLFYHIFFVKEPSTAHTVAPPRLSLLAAPLILSGAGLILGVWPQGLQTFLEAFHVEAIHSASVEGLSLWHGWSVELLLSTTLFAGGISLFFIVNSYHNRYFSFSAPSIARGWAYSCDKLPVLAKWITSVIHSTLPTYHLYWVFGVASLFIVFGAIITPSVSVVNFNFTLIDLISLFLTLTTVILLLNKVLMNRLVALSLVGFLIMLYYVVYGAADLAITQMVVEVATLFIILLLFASLPRASVEKRSIFRIIIAFVTGGVAASLPLYFDGTLFQKGLASFFLSESLPLGLGSNVVNVILVDFRGLDTLGEISVIAVCALAVYGIFRIEKKRSRSLIPSPLFSTLAPAICIATFVLGVYLLLRGHQSPGGGFSGGVVVAIGLVLLTLAQSGDHFRFAPMPLALIGLAIAAAAGLPSFFLGEAYMTSLFLPGFPFVSTPLIFDAALFVLVIGAVTATIFRVRGVVYGEDC